MKRFERFTKGSGKMNANKSQRITQLNSRAIRTLLVLSMIAAVFVPFLNPISAKAAPYEPPAQSNMPQQPNWIGDADPKCRNIHVWASPEPFQYNLDAKVSLVSDNGPWTVLPTQVAQLNSNNQYEVDVTLQYPSGFNPSGQVTVYYSIRTSAIGHNDIVNSGQNDLNCPVQVLPPTADATCSKTTIHNPNPFVISANVSVDGQDKGSVSVPANGSANVTYVFTDTAIHSAVVDWTGNGQSGSINAGQFGPCGIEVAPGYLTGISCKEYGYGAAWLNNTGNTNLTVTAVWYGKFGEVLKTEDLGDVLPGETVESISPFTLVEPMNMKFVVVSPEGQTEETLQVGPCYKTPGCPDGYQISGRVMIDGKPADGARLYFWLSPDGSSYWDDTTRQNGWTGNTELDPKQGVFSVTYSLPSWWPNLTLVSIDHDGVHNDGQAVWPTSDARCGWRHFVVSFATTIDVNPPTGAPFAGENSFSAYPGENVGTIQIGARVLPLFEGKDYDGDGHMDLPSNGVSVMNGHFAFHAMLGIKIQQGTEIVVNYRGVVSNWILGEGTKVRYDTSFAGSNQNPDISTCYRGKNGRWAGLDQFEFVSR